MHLPRTLVRAGGAAAALAGVATLADAQQFQQVPNAMPPKNWTEGLEACDVDNDGDLDLFVADGGGFQTPGTQYQNQLWMNLLESSPMTFSEEGVARLGVNVSHGKGVTTGDIDADGWQDALFANAFAFDVPFLYHNRGAAQPGFFDMESASRGFTTILSSGSAMMGDVDDDGDLDVLVNDGYFVGGSQRPRLYFNDGAGFFTEDVGFNASAPQKSSHMDVQLVDIDGDFDLDFVGPNRATNPGGNHYLMLNDGSGGFTDASTLLASTTSSVYEADQGDLDGDADPDLFFISLASGGGPFGVPDDGPMFNRIVPTGSLSFQNGTALSSDDDNEVALVDYDNDGDLDAFIGSLGNDEKMLRNNGAGVFSLAAGVIQAINDSTLDCTAADLDNDGDYDLVTVQGESSSATWDSKVYENTGAADTLAPVLKRLEDLVTTDVDGPWVVHAIVQDQVIDDGRTWVRGEVRYTLNAVAEVAAASITGAGVLPGTLNVDAGTTVTWTNDSGVTQSVASTTAPYAYDSGDLAPGETFSYTFVVPGTYDYVSVGGPSGTVVVGGSSSVGTTLSTGTWNRHEMTDTLAGTASELAYELAYTDWAGNTLVVDGTAVTLCGASIYGESASPANTIVLEGGGDPSVGGTFDAVSTSLPAGATTVFTGLSLGEGSVPLFGGIALIDLLLLVQVDAAGVVSGTAVQSYPIPATPGLAGADVYLQSAAPDGSQPGGWALSNGLKLVICP